MTEKLSRGVVLANLLHFDQRPNPLPCLFPFPLNRVKVLPTGEGRVGRALGIAFDVLPRRPASSASTPG
jgi:hypothetical protein